MLIFLGNLVKNYQDFYIFECVQWYYLRVCKRVHADLKFEGYTARFLYVAFFFFFLEGGRHMGGGFSPVLFEPGVLVSHTSPHILSSEREGWG